MIHRNHGDITFECDSCGETLDTNDDDWNVAWNMAKRDGWTSRKIAGEWEHSCLTCNEPETPF